MLISIDSEQKFVMMKYRLPAVAGSFYPAGATQLNHDVMLLLQTVKVPKTIEKTLEIKGPKALIVPHAGYCYSGAIAASAYACLKNSADAIQKVILLGPSHQVALQGCTIPSHDMFTTPNGGIRIDHQACQKLLDLDLVSVNDHAHVWEHSLEVQLPFLHVCLPNFKMVPIVVGRCSPEIISDILSTFVPSPDTLVVVSSDMSHYHGYHDAQMIDQNTITKIEHLAPIIQADEACGCEAINGLLYFCHQNHWQVQLIQQANSGDSSPYGDKNKVVGYASFIIH
jgi:AmmeMemoRadiSam system protein B